MTATTPTAGRAPIQPSAQNQFVNRLAQLPWWLLLILFAGVFLLFKIHDRKFFDRNPMRPTILVFAFQCIISRTTQETTRGNMHEILFFFFRKFLLNFSQFANADQKKNGIHIRCFTELILQLLTKLKPFFFAKKNFVLLNHFNSNLSASFKNGRDSRIWLR